MSQSKQVTVAVRSDGEDLAVRTQLESPPPAGERELCGDREVTEDLSDGPGHGS